MGGSEDLLERGAGWGKGVPAMAHRLLTECCARRLGGGWGWVGRGWSVGRVQWGLVGRVPATAHRLLTVLRLGRGKGDCGRLAPCNEKAPWVAGRTSAGDWGTPAHGSAQEPTVWAPPARTLASSCLPASAALLHSHTARHRAGAPPAAFTAPPAALCSDAGRSAAAPQRLRLRPLPQLAWLRS